MTDYGFARASDETLGIRNDLAQQVIRALGDAGLPAFREGEAGSADRAGAVIHVEPDAETMSAAVSVTWRCDSGKLQSAVEDLASGRADTPATRYPGVIGAHMQLPLVRILLAAGIIATPTHDCTDPNHVLVFGRVSDLPPALRPGAGPLRSRASG
ncbi:hypothetical protein ACIQUQ_34355 [Streptomyces sp. NPDC101118]|uniref:hypothetical protein n=1 Tax=Streptomyces sp. NPDC101118 TaxID=3366109 RepID=UPI003828ADCA